MIVQIETFVKYPKLVDEFVRFLCSELKVQPSKICIDSYDEDNGNLGLCIDQTHDEFLILVKYKDRNVEDVFITIAHEMVHVKQYMQENLGWFLDNRLRIPYHKRWWEQEAFAKAIPLVEKFAVELKQ
jgi:hypothetical protein